MSITRIVFLPPLATMPANWCSVDAQGAVLQRGVIDAGEAGTFDDCPVVAVVPGTDVSLRWLDLPKGRPAQIKASVRWQLGQVLALDDDTSIAIGTDGADGRTLCAAVATRRLEAWRDWLAASGMEPVTIVPDCACLPIPEDGFVVAGSMMTGDVMAVGPAVCVSAQADVVDMFLEGHRVTMLDPQSACEAIVRGALIPAINLRQDRPAKPAVSGRKWIKGLAAAVVASPILVVMAQGLNSDLQAHGAMSKARAVATSLLPAAAAQDDPVTYVEARLRDTPPAGGHVLPLAALVAALEVTQGTSLQEVEAVGGEMKGVLVLSDEAAPQTLRERLANSGWGLNTCEPVFEDGRLVCSFSIGEL